MSITSKKNLALLILLVLAFLFYQTAGLILANPPTDVDLSNAEKYLDKGIRVENSFPDSAIYYYQVGLQNLSGDLNDKESILKIKLLLKSGFIFHKQNKYSLAEDFYLKALENAESIGHDSLIAESYFSIAEIGLENGSYSKAIDSYKIARQKFESIQYYDGMFWSDVGLGIVYRELGNTDQSQKSYESAIQLGKEADRSDYIAISYNNLGNLYKQIGEYDSSLAYLNQSLISFQNLGEEKFISDCLESIGCVYLEIGNLNRALEYFNRSTEIAENLGDSYRLLSRYANKAQTYSKMNDNENALMFFSKTVELAQAIGDKARLSEILIMLSDYYRLQGDLNGALNQLNRSLSISKEVGDTVSIASAYNSLSELYFLTNDYNSAYQNALNSYQISSAKDLKKTLSESALKLSNLAELNNNPKDALFYFKIHERTEDLLLNAEKMRILEETEAKYKTEKIQREKLELENMALLNAEEVQRRNNLILILLLAILLSLAAGAWYLFKRSKEKVKTAQKASEMRTKIESLNNQLSEKNRELTSKALIISQNNDILKNVVESIDDVLRNGSDNRKELSKLKLKLQEIYEEKSWDDFLHHFEQVHPKFYNNLHTKCEDLSSMEQKVCAFIKMNLNTKDISQITGQSIKAIEVMRSRIRKKLEIPSKESLSKIIQSI